MLALLFAQDLLILIKAGQEVYYRRYIMGGWIGKVLRVDLTSGDYVVEDLEPDFARKYLGGQGFTSKVLMDEVDPLVDALSPENKLIFSTSPCTGSGAVSGARGVWAAKSPLTGGIGFANTGGYFPAELKFAGYDMIVFEGKAEEPVYLWIADDVVELRSALDLWGKTASETEDLIRAEVEDKWIAGEMRISCIGPAGENLVKMAAIMNDKHRAAGRGGLGAVMGSKNLKAVAVRGTGGVTIAKPEEFKAAIAAGLAEVKASPASGESFPKYGSAGLFDLLNSVGVLPHKNFREMCVEDGAKISGQAMAEGFLIRNRACYSCPLACGGPAHVTQPPFQGKAERPEYETHWIAAHCSVYNPAALLRFNGICNDMGIDTIDAGSTIACAMELFEKGYLPEKDVGFKLRFGDGEAMVKLAEQIGYRQGLGEVMAEGGCALAEKYGHPESFIHVKKMACTGYDVRNVKGMALNWATSVRGACHNRGYTIAPEIYGMPEKLDPLTIEGKAPLVKFMQDLTAGIMDAGGFCLFNVVGQSPHAMFAQLEPVTGVGYTFEEVVQTGERIWNLQRLFNLKAGLTKDDDTIPKRFMEESASGGPNKGNVLPRQEFEAMVKAYYEMRGWDRKTGYPTREKLTELGIEEYSHLLPS